MDDLISRQAAIAAFDCTDELIIGGSANAQNVMNYINKVIGKIKALPSAQPERKKGKWGNHGECPFCSYLRQWEDDRFCGNCGADMRGEQE